MKKLLLLLTPLLFLTSCSSWITPSATHNIKRKENTSAVNYIYTVGNENYTEGANVELKNVSKLQPNFDFNYTHFDFGNDIKPVPSSTEYYDCLDPKNNYLATDKSIKINETDDFYALKNESVPGGENGYFYHFVLQNYSSNFYFNDDLEKTSFYIPSLDLFDLNHYVTSNNVSYLRIPYLMINNINYLDLLYQGSTWYFETHQEAQITAYTDKFLLFEFDTIDHITDIQLFENYRCHPYYGENESKFIEKPSLIIPSAKMSNKYVSMPFEIYDVNYEKYCQLRYVSDSFSALISRASGLAYDSWIDESPSFGNSDKYIASSNFRFTARNSWDPRAEYNCSQYLNKINVTITDAHGVYDEEGVFHPSVETKTETLVINHTENIGGPSGKLLYQYFPDFPEFKPGTYGTINLDKIYFLASSGSGSSTIHLTDNLQVYDLSNFTKFKFTFDYRKTVRVAYYEGVFKNIYYSAEELYDQTMDSIKFVEYTATHNLFGNIKNTFDSIYHNNFKKYEPDSVTQYYAFDLSFSKDEYIPIPNIQKIEFNYRINKQDCNRSLKLNDKTFVEYKLKNGEVKVNQYNKYDTDGFGLFTQEEFSADTSEYFKNDDGEAFDYLLVHRLQNQLEPLVTNVSPVAIYYLEDSDLSIVSQAVTNELGLHYDEQGNVYDKDNNLRLDYKVVKSQYIDKVTGDVTEWTDIVDKATGETVKPNTGTNTDLGDNLDDFNNKSEWDKLVGNVKSFFNNVGKTINSWFNPSSDAFKIVQAIFWSIIVIIAVTLIIKLINAIRGNKRRRRR